MKSKLSYREFLIVLAVVLLAGSCTTKIITKGPIDPLEEEVTGLKYYLPENILIIDVTKKTITTKFLNNNCLTVEEKKREEYAIDPIKTDVIPDFGSLYTIEIKPRYLGVSADNISISRYERHFLKTVSIDSTGKAAEVAVNTLKAVASIAGAAYGLNIPFKAVAQIPGAELGMGKEDMCNWQKTLKDKYQIENEKDLTEVQGYTLLKKEEAGELYKKIIKVKEDVKKLESEISEKNKIIKKATAKKAKEVEKIIDERNNDLNRKEKELEQYKQAFNNIVQATANDLELGKTEKVEKLSEIFKIDELPKEESISTSTNTEGVWRKFERIGFAFSIDRFHDLTDNQNRSKNSSDNNKEKHISKNRNEKDNNEYIYYRDQVPVKLSVYNRPNEPDLKEIKPKENKDGKIQKDELKPSWQHYQSYSLRVFSKNDKPAKLPYYTSAFGQRKLVLNLSESGVLTEMQYVNAASANVLAENAATGVGETLEAFGTGVTKISNIEKAKMTIVQNQLQNKIDILKKRKEIIDADIGYQGVLANEGILKQQIQIDNEISYNKKLAAKIASGDELAIAEATSQINRDKAELSAISGYSQALSSISQSAIDNSKQIQLLNENLAALQKEIGNNGQNELIQSQIGTLQMQLNILQKLLEVQQKATNR